MVEPCLIFVVGAPGERTWPRRLLNSAVGHESAFGREAGTSAEVVPTPSTASLEEAASVSDFTLLELLLNSSRLDDELAEQQVVDLEALVEATDSAANEPFSVSAPGELPAPLLGEEQRQ